jgi:hypothetical protein
MGAGSGGATAFPLPLLVDTVLTALVRVVRAVAGVGFAGGDLASAEDFRGGAFFAALDAVDMVERIERLERVELFDADETERCTERPRLIVVSAVLGVRREGVVRFERTDDATDD